VGFTIKLKKEDLNRLHRHAKEEYPKECCGILVGLIGFEKEIKEVHECRNISVIANSYEIHPDDMYKVDKETRDKGLEVIGFYHSHPDRPPTPCPDTDRDREMALPGYFYLIISIHEGSKVSQKCWIWDEKSKKFQEEDLVLV